MGALSGPATARRVLRRQREVFEVAGFERLADISVAHPYNLRHSAGKPSAARGGQKTAKNPRAVA